jgi:N-acetylmuramoyl-L-alanine amidase
MLIIDRSKKFSEFFDVKTEARKIDFLVLHHVAATSANHAAEMFRECQVSSHFLVDELGKVFELVDENDVAYHAGVSFWRGVDAGFGC